MRSHKKHWRNGNIPQNIILLECPPVSARTVRRLLCLVVCLNHYSNSKILWYFTTCISIINGVHWTSSLSIYTNGRRARCFYIYKYCCTFFSRDCSVSPIFQFSRASSLLQHPCTRHITSGTVFLFVHHSKLFFLRDRQLEERTGVFPLLEEKLC